MGAGVSSFLGENDKNGELGSSPMKLNLGDIPESCVSGIFMYLDPPEICRLARLNRAFRGASWADFVWESKLPSNYKFLVKAILDQSPDTLGKKEIYTKLSTPSFFDGGTKQAWLDKSSGKICLSISYKALRITGIDDRRYWTHLVSEESRYQAIAYLQQIWWFEVVGELDFEFPPGTYSLFFRLQLGKSSRRFGRRVCNVDQVHGWNIKPVRFQLSTSSGHRASSECYLHQPGDWHHYHVGDFSVDSPNTPMRIKLSMMQIDCTHPKGGLCLDSVFIYPSEFRERLN